MINKSIKLIHPQEIAVWYILPSLRRELSIEIKKLGVKQKKVAVLLGVTEPAVSQYFNKKRAFGIKFSNKLKSEIKRSAMIILQDKKGGKLLNEMQRLMILPEMRKTICSLHKRSGKIPLSCRICLKK